MRRLVLFLAIGTLFLLFFGLDMCSTNATERTTVEKVRVSETPKQGFPEHVVWMRVVNTSSATLDSAYYKVRHVQRTSATEDPYLIRWQATVGCDLNELAPQDTVAVYSPMTCQFLGDRPDHKEFPDSDVYAEEVKSVVNTE